MAFFALRKKMRQVYAESQKQKFVQAYEEFSLTFLAYCMLMKITTCPVLPRSEVVA